MPGFLIIHHGKKKHLHAQDVAFARFAHCLVVQTAWRSWKRQRLADSFIVKVTADHARVGVGKVTQPMQDWCHACPSSVEETSEVQRESRKQTTLRTWVVNSSQNW